jgi:V-type H+-transporting ATPase subunit H
MMRFIAAIGVSPKGVADPEFDGDLRSLNDILTTNFRELTAFDRWVSQIYSGALRPGVVHTEKFWRENARFVEAEDFKLLKKLITFLRQEDPETVKLALFDLGEVARFYPNGRTIVGVLGGKDRALELLSNPDSDVSSKALQCVSKIMVSKWEYMK